MGIRELIELSDAVSSEIALLDLLYAALKVVPNIVIITDKDGNIVWVNDIFESYTGYSFNEVRGQNPRIFKSGVHDDAFYKNLWDTISSGKVWHGHISNKYRDGTIKDEVMTITPVIRHNDSVFYIAMKQFGLEESV